MCFLCGFFCQVSAQETDLNKYHRSSLYSILLKHPEKEFCNEMIEAFKSIPIPDKYNNHDLKIKVMPSPVLKAFTKAEIEGAYKDAITKMLVKNKIGGRLIEKWFDRDKATGCFDMNLVAERGYYDASILDVKEARASARGTALLADAGEELLNHTYVIVNDIRYADKETMKGAVAGGLFAAQLVGSFLGVDLSNVTNAVGGLAGNIAGFKVIVTSYLFRLDWNDETANNFSSNINSRPTMGGYSLLYQQAASEDCPRCQDRKVKRNVIKKKLEKSIVNSQKMITFACKKSNI